jgi:hypothetical protein
MDNQIDISANSWAASAGQMLAPIHVKEIIKDSIEKSEQAVHAVTDTVEQVTRDCAKTFNSVEGGSTDLGRKLMENYVANTTAVGQLIADVAQARTVPEACQVQIAFWQKQSQEWQRQMFGLSALCGRLAFQPALSATQILAKTVREASGHSKT